MELTTIRELYKNSDSYMDLESNHRWMGKKYPRIQSIWIHRGK